MTLTAIRAKRSSCNTYGHKFDSFCVFPATATTGVAVFAVAVVAPDDSETMRLIYLLSQTHVPHTHLSHTHHTLIAHTHTLHTYHSYTHHTNIRHTHFLRPVLSTPSKWGAKPGQVIKKQQQKIFLELSSRKNFAAKKIFVMIFIFENEAKNF